MMDKPVIRVAILDLYNRHPNQGMRGIRTLLYLESQKVDAQVRWHVFDVRHSEEIPDTGYDIYISSGGPGSPLASGEKWEQKYFSLMDSLREHNLQNEKKKYVFFICHSFQLICRHWKVATVAQRKSPAFGIFPVHKTEAGDQEFLFSPLNDPFYATDSREYQVIQPDMSRMEREGFELLALEKERPHVPLERAMMAIRFSEELVGTQFHPEADPHGMIRYFTLPEKKSSIINSYGEEKYYSMIDMLDDPDKLILTQNTIIPAFLRTSFENVMEAAEIC